MFHIIIFLISFSHASYNQYGAPGAFPMQQQLPGLPYILTKSQAFCKNTGSEMQGELSTSDTIVLKTPNAGGILACAQSVMFHAQQNMCSDVFWTNNNQCACLRPGVICKEERSEQGFAIYQLTRLGSQHKHAKKCAKKQSQVECEQLHECTWDAETCGSAIVLSSPHIYPATAAYPGAAYPGQLAAYPGARPPMAGAYPGAMGVQPQLGQMGMGMNPGLLNTQLVPWREGMDCEREIDDHTGLQNVIDLPMAANANLCMSNMQRHPQCNQQQFVFQKRADMLPGECSCIRMNLYCDEENRPGWQLYDFTKGPNAMGGIAPAGMMPQNHGMPMAGTMMGARPGAYGATGAMMGARPGYPATPGRPGMPGAVPGMHPGAAGAYGATGAYQAGMGMGATGAYQAGMGMGAYGATAGYPAAGYPATGAYQAGMGYGGRRLSKSHAEEATSSTKSFRSVVLYAVIPVAICLLIAAVIGFFYQRRMMKDSDYSNYILDDSKAPSV